MKSQAEFRAREHTQELHLLKH